jgi:hypothetical protein
MVSALLSSPAPSTCARGSSSSQIVKFHTLICDRNALDCLNGERLAQLTRTQHLQPTAAAATVTYGY